LEGALVITGPTASGKSQLTLELARYLGAEIISADSAQVYRGMDIGSAKPDAAELAEVKHHLIDIRDPDDPYSAAEFRKDCISLVSRIQSAGKLAIISGGTMLYLKGLKEGLAELPGADPDIRAEIARQAKEHGWEHVHKELARVDFESSQRIRATDPQRLQRAIEVFRLTGVPLSRLHRQSVEACPFPLLEMAIIPDDRSALHRAIESRFMEMLKAGFIGEVEMLRGKTGVHAQLPSIKAVGYRQVWSFLEGEIDEQTMIKSVLAATRQLAKRQHTWLRSWKNLNLLAEPNTQQALKIVINSTILEET
jgi:tRNA dimethylallyltransferase